MSPSARTLGKLAPLACAALLGCGGGEALPVAAAAAQPIATAAASEKAPAATTALSPEDALLERLERAAKTDFVVGFRGSRATRAEIAPVPFRVDELPIGRLDEVPSMVDYRVDGRTAAGAPALGELDSDLLITPIDPSQAKMPVRMVRISVKTAGEGPHGLSQVGISENIKRGVSMNSAEVNERCGEAMMGDRFSLLRWSRLRIDLGRPHLTIADVVLDRVKCEIHGLQRAELDARPLLPDGLVVAARACGETCQKSQTLVVAFPRTGSASLSSLGSDPREFVGTMTLVEIPIEHGGGGGFVAAIPSAEIVAWHKALSGVDMTAPASGRTIGIEITQSVRESAPTAIAYVDTVDPSERGIGPIDGTLIEKATFVLGAARSLTKR